MTSDNPSKEGTMPVAKIEPATGSRWWGLLPWGALTLLVVLLIQSWISMGPTITIRFRDGHGIKPGNTLRFRGIMVGEVKEVGLSKTLEDVFVQVRLTPQAEGFSRAGSQFWIVRPEISLYEVKGMDTVIGAHYLAGLPGDGKPCLEFIGSEEPPARKKSAASKSEFVLLAPRRGSIRAGMPVLYRQVDIGTVTGIDLLKDATGVEIRIAIDAPYEILVVDNARFWNSSGIGLNLGFLKGFNLDIDSLQSVLAGGVSLAVPDEPGSQAKPGRRFALADAPEKEWLAWQPSIPLDSLGRPGRTDLVLPIRARAQEKESLMGGLFSLSVNSRCLVTPLEEGLIGPSDILSRKNLAFEMGTQTFNISGELVQVGSGLSLMRCKTPAGSWKKDRLGPLVPETSLFLQGEAPTKTWFIPSNRISPAGANLEILWEKPISSQWHGAPAISREGNLIGIFLLRSDGKGIIVPVPK